MRCGETREISSNQWLKLFTPIALRLHAATPGSLPNVHNSLDSKLIGSERRSGKLLGRAPLTALRFFREMAVQKLCVSRFSARKIRVAIARSAVCTDVVRGPHYTVVADRIWYFFGRTASGVFDHYASRSTPTLFKTESRSPGSQEMVARGGIEPSTLRFSVVCSTN